MLDVGGCTRADRRATPSCDARTCEACSREAGRRSRPAPTQSHKATLDRYCVTCHSDRLKTAGLTLESIDTTNIAAAPDVWEKVVRKVRVGMMPPQGSPAPDAASRAALVSWLTGELDAHAAAHPDPGRPLVHRLNRAEYGNAIRDLLDLEIDPASLLPADDSAYGFDNVADVLGVSPVLLERYLSAAGKVSALAVGDPDSGVASETFRVRQDASQDRHVEGLPIGTVGGMLAHTTLPLDGEYVIQPRLFRTNLGAMRGLEYAHQLEITVDGARVHLASFGGDEDFKASLKNPTLAGDDVEARSRGASSLTAGPHTIGVAFIEKTAAQNSWRLQPFLRSSHDTFDPTGYPHIDVFSVTGPYNATGSGDTPSRRRVFMCRPATAAEEEPCARRIVSTLARLGVSRAGQRRRHSAADVVLCDRPPRRELREGRSAGAAAHARERQVRAARRARSCERKARLGVSAEQPRPGVAALVLLVEQHSGRRAAARRRAGQAANTRRAASAASTHARRSRSPRRSSPTSPGSGSTCVT